MKHLVNKLKIKKSGTTSFFDYPEKEKIDIITKAAKEANKMQSELVKKYTKLQDNTSCH